MGRVDENKVVASKPPVTGKSIAKADSTASPSGPGGLGLNATSPAPPSQLAIQFFPQLTGIALIADSLTKLDDQDMLRKARTGSWLIDHSIYKLAEPVEARPTRKRACSEQLYNGRCSKASEIRIS